MASKIFLDANILLDFALKREAYLVARKLMEMIMDGKVQAVITPAIVHILGYWLTKAYGVVKAKEVLLTILSDVRVITIEHDIVVTALHSKIKDIEDALQYYAALHHKADCFISRDHDLRKASLPVLPVYTAREFIKEFYGV